MSGARRDASVRLCLDRRPRLTRQLEGEAPTVAELTSGRVHMHPMAWREPAASHDFSSDDEEIFSTKENLGASLSSGKLVLSPQRPLYEPHYGRSPLDDLENLNVR